MRDIGRRTVLLGGAALAAACARGGGRMGGPRGLRVDLLGQALIQHDICRQSWDGFGPLRSLLSSGDVVFSDLETVIRGPRAGAPTRVLETLHAAPPEVIDCLKRIGINLLATANNHAFDLGTGGILDTLAALRARGMAFAGSGLNLREASRAGIVRAGGSTVALVAAAAGSVREGGAATETRAGVAELRRDASGNLEAGDVARTLAEIRGASARADLVIAYLHNHYWEPENWRTSAWQRQFARQCIDAGAGIFVAHGAPLLHGIEMYRGAPLFQCLGSFIFQTSKGPEAYGEHAWQSVIARCRFERGRFVGAELVPVQLNAVGAGGHHDLETRGRPAIAEGADAARILDRLEALSEPLGYRPVRGQRTARMPA